jgi:glycosyltransferase involved in cell wall biosynthesis
MNKLAFVVPTKDRQDDLRRMLASLVAQTCSIDQIIVVDGSAPDIRSVIDEFPALGIDYVRVFPPSLAKQRNAGMQKLRPDITLAGYLDDDVVLEPDAIEKILAYWDSASGDLGGTVFNITNTAPPTWARIKSLCWLDSPTAGCVLPSGCTSILGHQTSNIDTDWLCGGATIWKREVIDRYAYDEWFQGTGYLEDVDYSFNVRGQYRLALVANAKLAHYSYPIRPDRHVLLGRWQITNRLYLVRKYRSRGLSPAKAWIASFALLGLHLAQALLRLDGLSFKRARGNLMGIADELLGRASSRGGFLK